MKRYVAAVSCTSYTGVIPRSSAICTDNMIQLPGNDAETPSTITLTYDSQPIPSSPPPSFRSRASSPSSQHLISQDPIASDAERTLADTFDDGQASDDEGDNEGDDRQRLMRRASTVQEQENSSANWSTVRQTQPISGGQANSAIANVPVPSVRAPSSGTAYATFSSSNDGVFANLDAKPERGEKTEDQPPVCSDIPDICTRNLANQKFTSPTNKQQQTPHPPTGRRPSSPPEWCQTRSTSTASPSDPSSPSSGTASSPCPSSLSASSSPTSCTPPTPPRTAPAPALASRSSTTASS